jgi:hypothetical protein
MLDAPSFRAGEGSELGPGSSQPNLAVPTRLVQVLKEVLSELKENAIVRSTSAWALGLIAVF